MRRYAGVHVVPLERPALVRGSVIGHEIQAQLPGDAVLVPRIDFRLRTFAMIQQHGLDAKAWAVPNTDERVRVELAQMTQDALAGNARRTRHAARFLIDPDGVRTLDI